VSQFVAFSRAFNTVSHQQMDKVLAMVGIPKDARNVIRDLYTDCSTVITNSTPAFSTNEIPIKQGVIQGDTLSPTIFIIMMDPLLRWLEVGDRGLDTGIVNNSTGDRLIVSSEAYADDLTTISRSIQDQRKQNIKIGEYSLWIGTKLNPGKCECTYVDWSDSHPLCKSSREQYKRMITGPNPLTILTDKGDQAIPFVDPTQPVKYLGALISLDLETKQQMEVLRQEVKSASSLLLKSVL